MATEIILPKVDMVMETATFVEWLKKEGEVVSKGDSLFVIMTDKAAIECEAPASGRLSGISAKPDDLLPVATVIGYILESGEAPVQKASQPLDVKIQKSSSQEIKAAPVVATPSPETRTDRQLLRATPLARNTAQTLGIDLTTVTGRGVRGRIYNADVLAAAEAIPETGGKNLCQPVGHPLRSEILNPEISSEQKVDIPLPEARIRERVSVKGIRSIIAQRLAYSAFTSPHIYLSINVDMSEVVRWRQKTMPIIERKLQKRLSFTTIIAYVVAKILPNNPYLNSSLAENEIILWEDVHLGIATALDNDLIVPVVRQAQTLSLLEFTQETSRLLEAARARKLQPSELTGSTFTISNLGMFGVDSFTAILNPPEAGLLAVAKMTETPLVQNGQVIIRPIINFTLATDHRINDGLRASRFLSDLKDTLENPYLLI